MNALARSTFSFIFSAVLIANGAMCSQFAEEPAVADRLEKAAKDRWQATYTDIAGSIEMSREGSPLEFVQQPLLRYTNPVRPTDQDGAIFLWTSAGRPAVIGSIWSAAQPRNPLLRVISHEWHSLTSKSDVAAKIDGQEVWSCREAGVTWQRMADAPEPAAHRAARLAQMRSLMGQYSASLVVDREQSELRLMAQPLYRHLETDNQVIDGAIFAFAMGTDPEVFALLEAQRIDEKAAWHVAFARFGNKQMVVKRDSVVVWECEDGIPGHSDGKYYLRWRADEVPAMP